MNRAGRIGKQIPENLPFYISMVQSSSKTWLYVASSSSFDNAKRFFIPWYKNGIGIGLYSCENSYSCVLEDFHQIKHWARNRTLGIKSQL